MLWENLRSFAEQTMEWKKRVNSHIRRSWFVVWHGKWIPVNCGGLTSGVEASNIAMGPWFPDLSFAATNTSYTVSLLRLSKVCVEFTLGADMSTLPISTTTENRSVLLRKIYSAVGVSNDRDSLTRRSRKRMIPASFNPISISNLLESAVQCISYTTDNNWVHPTQWQYSIYEEHW